MTPTVSVIIPAYNSAHFVSDAIDSALRQAHPPQQVIVVNDGSTDDTESVLARYTGRITVIRQPNAGLPSARNSGLRIASGDWIGFLDADDVWHPQKLALQLAAAASAPDVGLIGTATFDFPHRMPPELNSSGELERLSLDRLLVRNYLTASSVIVRRDVADRVGEFDAPLPNAEDWDYWQRAAEIASVANLSLPLTGYRQVPGSLSRRPIAMETGIRQVIQKLDERDAWNNRRWLRRRAMGHLHFSIAHLYGASGRHATALVRMLQSFVSYPLPFNQNETSTPYARPRRAAVLLARCLGLIPADPGGRATGGRRDA